MRRTPSYPLEIKKIVGLSYAQQQCDVPDPVSPIDGLSGGGSPSESINTIIAYLNT